MVIERDGLDSFSIRKLAAELGCEAMSVYHHFASKARIMDALLDRFVAEVPVPTRGAWDDRLRRLAANYRAAALRNPELFRFIAVHRHNTRAGMKWLDGIVGIIEEGGFDRETTARIFRAFGYYLTGAVLDETAGYARGPSAADPVSDDVGLRDYPRIAAINPWFRPSHHKATFDFGLEAMLAGIGDPGAADARRGRANRSR